MNGNTFTRKISDDGKLRMALMKNETIYSRMVAEKEKIRFSTIFENTCLSYLPKFLYFHKNTYTLFDMV
jgi:hypothetical protein